ncbi:uncharacterized protein K444DRAFT_401851 [Hyaloscypha bicolor E]|uniref:Uncharacterized protein n=1 Tax=Hyaloscypha bicolor E TaxID=1095630 RepID=A0A2J6TA49_9HELO|nr:uncharacterized protein K444DRAFT_401851 [Hyaloscypha bicolor E]PMD59862.1 hypothetical protein K444DRAFT_401851 [Hyaloscypha bicolor E]
MKVHTTRKGVTHHLTRETRQRVKVFFSFLTSGRAFSINICALLAFQAQSIDSPPSHPNPAIMHPLKRNRTVPSVQRPKPESTL